MNAREEGFLLLTSNLGDPNRHPLTTAQLRTLAERVRGAEHLPEDRQVESRDLMALGYSGKAIGTCLSFLLEQVVDEKLPNEKDSLLAAAKMRLQEVSS